jgi:hypothetical protein
VSTLWVSTGCYRDSVIFPLMDILTSTDLFNYVSRFIRGLYRVGSEVHDLAT